MKKLITLLLTAVLLLMPLSGCQSDTAETVRVNEVTHSIFYAPFYAAIELGYFREAGLTIELTNGGGSDKSMTALLTDQADFGLMGPETAVYVYHEGQKDHPVIIAQLTQRDGSFLVGKEPDPDFSWEKLRGKSVIGGRTGGMPEMTLEYALRKNGMEPNTDVTVRTDVSFDLLGGAFLAGNDDYVSLFEPSASTMARAGEGYIVASVGAETDFVAYTCLMVTKSYRDAHRDTVQKFVSAIARGQEYVHTASPEEIARTIAPSFPDSDEALITDVIKNYQAIDAWRTSPATRQADFEQLLKVIADAGILDDTVPFDQLVDNTFAEP